MHYTVKFKTSTKRNNGVDDLDLNVRVTASSETEAEARAYAQLIAYGYQNRWELSGIQEDQ